MSEDAARVLIAHVMSGMHYKGVMFVTIGIAFAEHFTLVYPQSHYHVRMYAAFIGFRKREMLQA